MVFLNGLDTLRMNVKIPFDVKGTEIINLGIFYNCHLKVDSLYTICLKKICIKDIPEFHNSYYKTNAKFDTEDCSKFIEFDRNTEYEYKGNYGMYVDIDNILYQIIGLTPNDMCVFQH